MRDYGLLIAQLRGPQGGQVGPEAAEALEELLRMAGRMTSLGVDLEEQIKDDLTPDLYVTGDEKGELIQVLTLDSIECANIMEYVPFRLKAVKVIGDSWFVFFPGEPAPREYITEDAALQAVNDHRQEQEK